jgi:hypothetical protein
VSDFRVTVLTASQFFCHGIECLTISIADDPALRKLANFSEFVEHEALVHFL